MKKQLLSILALLLMAAGSAMAQTESVTITGTTTTGTNVTVTADEFSSEGAWLDFDEDHKMVVATNDGSNIEQLVLTVGAMGQNAGYVQASPGTCTVNGGGSSITVTGINASSVTLSISTSFIQITVVEVTFAAPAPSAEPTLSMRQFTRTASGTWTLNQMPAFDGILEITFREAFTLDSIPLTWTVIVDSVDKTQQVTPYTSEQGDTTLGWLNILEGSFVELIPPTVVKPTVKSVELMEAPAPAPVVLTLDLATVTTDTTVGDGYTVIGTLGANVKISIADGATVTLDGVTINGVDEDSYNWAGINCLGDATIILTGENTVKGFNQSYPGIYVPENNTVTIQGIGSLTASSSNTDGVAGAGIGGGFQLACGNITIMGGSITAMGCSGAAGIGSGNNGYSCGNITITGGTINASANTGSAGIGSGNNGSCGNITITGGNITATGGSNAAGIGSGLSASCGNITITGGTINATGTNQAAGIGSGYAANNKTASCGNITITNGVTSVTATKGNATVPNSIGVGKTGNNNATNTCGTVTIGCTLDTSGNPVGGTTGAISESPYTYPQN